jgi:hypothetical protein
MNANDTTKITIRLVVDGEGRHAVGTTEDDFDELAANADLALPIASYELEIEVPSPRPVRAGARIEGAAAAPLRVVLK